MWSFQLLPEPPASVAPAVAAFGDGIIVSLRALVESTPSDRRAVVDATSLEFSDWTVAVRALQEQSNVSFAPQLQEIATLARLCPDDYGIRMTVLRAASFYLQKWAGIAPLPDIRRRDSLMGKPVLSSKLQEGLVKYAIVHPKDGDSRRRSPRWRSRRWRRRAPRAVKDAPFGLRAPSDADGRGFEHAAASERRRVQT